MVELLGEHPPLGGVLPFHRNLNFTEIHSRHSLTLSHFPGAYPYDKNRFEKPPRHLPLHHHLPYEASEERADDRLTVFPSAQLIPPGGREGVVMFNFALGLGLTTIVHR